VKATPLLIPPLHEYVAAPTPFNIIEFPVHTCALEGKELTVTTGKGFTITCTVAVFVHPAAFVPVTVYKVEAAGTKEIPLLTPPLHE
jgi:hypothetical protein